MSTSPGDELPPVGPPADRKLRGRILFLTSAVMGLRPSAPVSRATASMAPTSRQPWPWAAHVDAAQRGGSRYHDVTTHLLVSGRCRERAGSGTFGGQTNAADGVLACSASGTRTSRVPVAVQHVLVFDHDGVRRPALMTPPPRSGCEFHSDGRTHRLHRRIAWGGGKGAIARRAQTHDQQSSGASTDPRAMRCRRLPQLLVRSHRSGGRDPVNPYCRSGPALTGLPAQNEGHSFPHCQVARTISAAWTIVPACGTAIAFASVSGAPGVPWPRKVGFQKPLLSAADNRDRLSACLQVTSIVIFGIDPLRSLITAVEQKGGGPPFFYVEIAGTGRRRREDRPALGDHFCSAQLLRAGRARCAR